MKNTLKCALVALLTFTFVACNKETKEERVINQLEEICTTLESDDFKKSDFTKVGIEYEKTMKLSEECEFSDEQKKEVAKLQGRISAAASKKVMGIVGDQYSDILDGANDFVEGFAEEFGDFGEEMENLEDKISSSLDNLNDILGE